MCSHHELLHYSKMVSVSIRHMHTGRHANFIALITYLIALITYLVALITYSVSWNFNHSSVIIVSWLPRAC